MFATVLRLRTPATVAGFPTFILVCAAWGYVVSWVNEFVKQDGWSKLANTLVADAILLVSAALATFTQTTFSFHALCSAVLAVGAAALLNHNFFLQPTGVGPAVQTATSIKK